MAEPIEGRLGKQRGHGFDQSRKNDQSNEEQKYQETHAKGPRRGHRSKIGLEGNGGVFDHDRFIP
jgi:hypothetical protein